MKSSYTAYTATTPFGDILFSDVSDNYTQKIARDMETLVYEKEITDVVIRETYDRFIDVGAAFGYFTLLAAQKATVIAFEPHPIRFGYLWWNTRNLSGVTIRPEFVGHATNIFASDNPSGLMGKQVGTRRKVAYSPTKASLAPLIDAQADTLIKIDVEGFEESVIDTLGSDICLNPNTKWIIELHSNLVAEQDVLKYFAGRTTETLLERGNTKTVMIS